MMNDLVFGLDSLSINQSTMNRRRIVKSYHTTTPAAMPYGNIDWSFPPKTGNFWSPSAVSVAERPRQSNVGGSRLTPVLILPMNQKNKDAVKREVFSPICSVSGQEYSARSGITRQSVQYNYDDSVFDRFRSFSVQNNPTPIATRKGNRFSNGNNVRKQRCGSDSSALKILAKNFVSKTTIPLQKQENIQQQRRQNLDSVSSIDYQGLYKFCSFCKMNNETQKIYEGHELFYKGTTKVQCPYLRGYVCPICKCTGDNAHTMSYCPQNPNGKEKTYRQRMTSKRLSSGKFRKD